MFKERKIKSIRKQIDAQNVRIAQYEQLIDAQKKKPYVVNVLQTYLKLAEQRKESLERELTRLEGTFKQPSDFTKKLQDKVSLKEEVTKKLSSEEPELAKILKKIDKIENNTHWKSQAKIGIIVALIVGIPLFFIGWVLPSPFQP